MDVFIENEHACKKLQDWYLKSENRFFVSLLKRSIQDHSDHGTSKEPNNSYPEWILPFLWCTMQNPFWTNATFTTLKKVCSVPNPVFEIFSFIAGFFLKRLCHIFWDGQDTHYILKFGENWEILSKLATFSRSFRQRGADYWHEKITVNSPYSPLTDTVFNSPFHLPVKLCIMGIISVSEELYLRTLFSINIFEILFEILWSLLSLSVVTLVSIIVALTFLWFIM